MVLFLQILGGIAALLVGVWLGLPGRHRTADEIEEQMEQGPGRRKKVKKRFVAVAWLQRQISNRTLRKTRGFSVRAPDDYDF